MKHLRPRVLVAEDDVWLRPILAAGLQEVVPGVEIDWVETADDALSMIQATEYQLVIADIFLRGDQTGLGIWNQCQLHRPEMPVLLTSSIPIDVMTLAMAREGAEVRYLKKPFNLNECKQVFEAMLSFTGPSS